MISHSSRGCQVQPIVAAGNINCSLIGSINRREDAVRFPQISIAEIMALVVIAALDCLALRIGGSPPAVRYLICGGLPMQSVLVIGLLPMLRQRAEKPTPFLMGFEVVGWICLLTYVVVCIKATNPLIWHLSYTLYPVLNVTCFPSYSTADYVWRYVVVTTYLTVPQIAAALVAGWSNRRCSERLRPELFPSQQ